MKIKKDKTNQEIFNPENIQPGDYVKIKNPRAGDPRGVMKVETVGGRYGNKVFCEKIGHEVYADCFEKVYPIELQSTYKSFDEFVYYNSLYNISKRLGYKNSKTAWRANPIYIIRSFDNKLTKIKK